MSASSASLSPAAASNLPRMHVHRLAPTAAARAVRNALLAMACMAVLPSLTQAADQFAASVQATRNFNVAAGPLAGALSGFAADSGVSVSAPPALMRGLVSPGLKGNYTIQEGLLRLLEGTGLIVEAGGTTHYVLRKNPEVATTESSTETTLPQVTVMAAALDATSEGSGSYAASATSIGKSTQSLRETPQSVTVLTRQRLDDQNLRTMDEALMNTTGIIVQQSSSHERTFYSRGFEVDTVQYDGVPTQRGNGFSISPDLAIYDRVEVLRGPAGLFNGAGRPGGTVNLVRKRPVATPLFSAQLSAGSWDNYRTGIDVSRPLNESGSVRGRLVAAYEDKKFHYDIGSGKRSILYGIVETDLGSHTTLGAGISYEKNDMVPYYTGLPRFSDGRDLGLPRSTYLNGAWAKTDIESTTLFADLNHRINDDWKVKIGLSRMKENNHDFSAAISGTVDPGTNTGPTLSSFKANLVGEQTVLDATLDGSFAAFGRKHDVIVGGNIQRTEYDLYSQRYQEPLAVINPFTFDPRNYATQPTVPLGAATVRLTKQQQSGVYGSLRFALSDPMKLIVGGRISQWRTVTQNLVTGTDSTQPYKDKGKFTPYGALTYDIDSNWTAYGSYAEIFRSQANQFTANGDRLDPATGDNYEAGIKGAIYDGKLNVSLAVFRTIESNRSQTDFNHPSPCAGSPTNGACFIAEGKVRSQGLDAELSGEPLKNLQVAVGYTYNQTKYLIDRTATGADSANVNKPLLTFAPRHLFRVWSNYQLPNDLSAWSVGGGVNVQSKTYKTGGTAAVPLRFEQEAYAVWSTRIGYRINRNWTAALNINNLFDKNYYKTIGGVANGNWYGEPRNAMLTLQATY